MHSLKALACVSWLLSNGLRKWTSTGAYGVAFASHNWALTLCVVSHLFCS